MYFRKIFLLSFSFPDTWKDSERQWTHRRGAKDRKGGRGPEKRGTFEGGVPKCWPENTGLEKLLKKTDLF